MSEPKNTVLASCATILVVMSAFVLALFIIGAGILIFNLAVSGL
jgi:hypothetical protein